MKMRDIINLLEDVSVTIGDYEISTMYDDPDDNAEPRYGDTVAYHTDPEKAGEHAGRLAWYVEDGEAHIVSIEVEGTVPLLSIRMIDQMRGFLNLPIDPGMMNASGKRLWAIYQRRRLAEGEDDSSIEDTIRKEEEHWKKFYHPLKGVIDGRSYTVRSFTNKDGRDCYVVSAGSRIVARATLSSDGTYVSDVAVSQELQKRGIASALYRHIEADKGISLKPSPLHQTQQGKALWSSRQRYHGGTLGEDYSAPLGQKDWSEEVNTFNPDPNLFTVVPSGEEWRNGACEGDLVYDDGNFEAVCTLGLQDANELMIHLCRNKNGEGARDGSGRRALQKLRPHFKRIVANGVEDDSEAEKFWLQMGAEGLINELRQYHKPTTNFQS